MESRAEKRGGARPQPARADPCRRSRTPTPTRPPRAIAARATEPVGDDAAGERRRARRPQRGPCPATRRSGRAVAPDTSHPTAGAGTGCQRQADPEDDASRDHDRRRRQHEQDGSSEAAPTPRGSRPSGERSAARTRPANAPSRLAMNGAAARAARPIGSRPPRRAMVGSSDDDEGEAHAGADRARPGRGRDCARSRAGCADGLRVTAWNTTYLEAPAWPAR